MADEDEMARRIRETATAPTRDVPLQPESPVPPVGQHPALERRCDAPGCLAMTPRFVATPDSQIIHYCDAHVAWAMAQA